ncbi:MAG: hypothetical protein A4E30_00775 [Methanomassiliicoccales archaeon PtaB.Bin215]|nr:MAG: hypothetical protein A4E30_00775 [Methanomassiliicoccales archaeon PtaB.Bin215]
MVCDKGTNPLPSGPCIKPYLPQMDPNGFDPEIYIPEFGLKITVHIRWDLATRTIRVEDVVYKSYKPKAK